MNSRGIRIVSALSPLLLTVLTVFASQALAQIQHVKDMNTEQIRALDRDKTVVLLPGGILEQHGPYLPAFADGYQNERLTQELANAIVERPGWQVLVFPLIPLGVGGANEIGSKFVFSGTYAVRFATLRAVFMDLATELGEQGFRWVFVIHLHGAPNHNRALDQAGDYFHDTYGGHMVNLTGLLPAREARAEAAQQLMSEEARQEEGFAAHASMNETSRLLFLRPDLVQPAYKQAPPLTGRSMLDLILIAQTEHWPGYFGSPRLASAAAGATLWKRFSARFVEVALQILDGLDDRQMKRLGDVTRTIAANATIDNAALEHDRSSASKQEEWLRSKGLE
jgi:creatinine amidohydrolase/Fe(II)-dependent formamide hydrolase-like protein